jgi:hypothetical protein
VAILAGVEMRLAPYLATRAQRVLDAWDHLDGTSRARVEDQLDGAVNAATQRVTDELRGLFASDPDTQSATPLQIVRGATREPTQLLVAIGVPPVARDEFDERTLPDDRYGLAPRSFAELGDADLGPQHLAWGLAKAATLRARRAEDPK